ncbi:hypothetical protein TNCV_3418411 [Trichonephila clavipes]|nr:hypothetical protein TNCV_3418411 [Trichonephila clavipes]
MNNGIKEVFDLSRRLNSELDRYDVQKLLDSYNKELAIDELLEMLQTAENAAIVEKMENQIIKDGFLTVREISEQVGVNTGSVLAVLCDHAQSDCEICSQSSVGGTERIPSCNCASSTADY